MEELPQFPIGAEVSLERATPDGPVVLPAKLAEQDGRSLTFAPVGRRWRGVPFAAGSHIIARIDTETATLVAELDVLSVSPDGRVTARQPLMIQRFAKRRFHRTPVDLPLIIGETACRAIDLSGCGLLAHCPKDSGIMKQDIVSATLFLESGAPIPLTMYVVRAGEAPKEGRLIGCDFMEIKEIDQDRVIAYVLRQERKRLQAMRKL